MTDTKRNTPKGVSNSNSNYSTKEMLDLIFESNYWLYDVRKTDAGKLASHLYTIGGYKEAYTILKLEESKRRIIQMYDLGSEII